MDTFIRKVVSAESYSNLTGRDMWRLKLECGHNGLTPCKSGKPAPKRQKCSQCELEAILPGRYRKRSEKPAT